VSVENYIIISITVYNILLILLLQLTEEAKNRRSSSRLKSDKKTTDAEIRRKTHKILNQTYFCFVEDIPVCYTIERQ